MALPPTIPTSFVPRQPVATGSKKSTSGSNPFLMLSYIILAVAILGSVGAYGYKFYLDGVAKQKSADLVAEENKIDQGTVTEFIRLRDRFTLAKDLLSRHIVLSHFFDVLETATLQGVRFNTLNVHVLDDRSAQIDLAGSARSFNALAAQSSAFGAEKRIKRAIFSGITVNPANGSVTFALKAELDPALVTSSASGAATSVPITPAPAPATPAPTATTTPVQPVLPATTTAATTTKP